MPTPGHSWHQCSGSPCASLAPASSCSRHCCAPAPENAAAKPLPTQSQPGRALCSTDPAKLHWGDAGPITALLGTEHGHSHGHHSGPMSCSSTGGSSWECFFVLQQIWSGRCHTPPAPIPEVTRVCVLAPSFGWWVLRGGPAGRDDLQHSFYHGQETVSVALSHRLGTGNPREHSKHLPAPTEGTVPPHMASPRKDGKRPHLPPPSPTLLLLLLLWGHQPRALGYRQCSQCGGHPSCSPEATTMGFQSLVLLQVQYQGRKGGPGGAELGSCRGGDMSSPQHPQTRHLPTTSAPPEPVPALEETPSTSTQKPQAALVIPGWGRTR